MRMCERGRADEDLAQQWFSLVRQTKVDGRLGGQR
jgi:hypothetical protein